MNHEDWAIKKIDEKLSQPISFKEKAILFETKNVIKEQFKRIDQSEAELDGRSWTPNKW
ncbi:hypothetical protein [Lactobacillus sp. S2-2]|uniref:hypothetical protein n=1 Tax=Lactobacillus sp. S2-2 TaxID=2692917 RepID=UPI001F42C053|nr:hypothetical protein [Lactobacillus sp. S2-2]